MLNYKNGTEIGTFESFLDNIDVSYISFVSPLFILNHNMVLLEPTTLTCPQGHPCQSFTVLPPPIQQPWHVPMVIHARILPPNQQP